MQATTLLKNYAHFRERELTNRFFKHNDIVALLKKLPSCFERSIAGQSHHGRDLHLVKWGKGPVKVFLWSQMHGDEPTGTMALFDLFNFLQLEQYEETIKLLQNNCTLYMLPMVNPDGAEKFTRRNAQQIDINRDYHQTVSPEATLLKQIRETIGPHFGFNLHDQSTLWSVKKTGRPATLSYLAPAFDESLTINEVRKNAMLVIADIHETLAGFLPQQIGLFDDEYEPRAFGDNFQAAGTSTILIEAGGLVQDEEKQEIREYFFLSILCGLRSISSKKYEVKTLQHYHQIPNNNKEIFHILIKEVMLNQTRLSIGLSYEEEPQEDGFSTQKNYVIKDLGDLKGMGAYHIFEGNFLEIEGEIAIDKNANFKLKESGEIILAFSNGILQSKL